MKRQLILLDPSRSDWRLDERTREVGRHGLAAARAALELAAPPAAAGAAGPGAARPPLQPTSTRSRRRAAPSFASPHGPTAA